ncbi:MAG: hypothetical protein KC646_14185 [Candidatus Cloacimonetes bacterium]|nr:hypothetical protein [Candidatus Cloacimonadota bacterium]
MTRILLLFLLMNNQFLHTSEDLFKDILLKENGSYQAESRSPIQTDISVEEKVFESQLYFSIAEKAEERLKKVSQKIELMDQAITLPIAIAQKYQKKQKELIVYKSELAHRVIKGYLNSKRPESKVKTPKDYTINQALKVSQKLDGDELVEFVGNWEASYTSVDAKRKFAPYLVMVDMYGVDHHLSKKASLSLKKQREEIYQFRTSNYKAPREEEVEYIHDVIKVHKGVMSYPVQRSLERVKKTENLLKSNELKAKQISVLRDRLYREKEALISFLSRDGLEIFPSHAKNKSSFEDRFKEWFEKQRNKKKVQKLAWPLKDEGVILTKFTAKTPYLTLRPEGHLHVLSPINGQVLRATPTEINLSSKHFEVTLMGKFDLLTKTSDQVKSGDNLAIIEDKQALQVHLKVAVPGLKTNYKTTDFLSHF